MRGLLLLALHLLRPAAAAPALSVGKELGPGGVPAGQIEWRFFPLHVAYGQKEVTCGSGFVVEWFVQVGDYVKEGDPICETCPGTGTSTTCTAPASGQVVAEQPLGPEDDLLAKVPDGVVAVIQPSGGHLSSEGQEGGRGGSDQECHPVKCTAGVSFGQFLASQGDVVHRGDVVALSLTAEGTMDHCRAPVGGVLASLAAHIQRGQPMDSLKPSRTVACVKGSGNPEPPAHGPGGHRTCADPAAKRRSAAAGDGHRAPAGSTGHPSASAVGAPSASARGSERHSGGDGASAAPQQGEQTPTSLRKLPPAQLESQRAPAQGDEFVSHGGERRRPSSGAWHPGIVAVIWASVGLAAAAMAGLGAFAFCGKTQSRSFYMLMQDARDEMPTKGLRMDFRDGNGSEQSFCFESQPLGIVFSRQTPVRVERFEFNSHAKDRGVQLGWVLARIAEQEITSQHSLPDVDRMLHGHVKTLAFWPLRVDFDTGNGAIKAFYFMKQPLGVEITRHAPFRISLFKPDSYARSCGVELGWAVVRVGDAVINQRTSYTALNAYFESGLSHLPQEPKGLRMDFSDPATGKERAFYFQRRPLGLVLTRYKPVRVQGFEFNSYARERGVQTGWAITRIGDQAVPSGQSSDQIDKSILDNSATLAVWPLRVDFDTGRGVRTFYFERQPLGMELLNRLPIRVDTLRPDSYARTCGVQLGWAITRVGDHEVTRDTKFEQVIECLVEGVCELPLVDSKHSSDPQAAVQRGAWSGFC